VSKHLFSASIYLSMNLTIVLSTDIQNWHDSDAKISNSLIQQQNVNRLARHITIKVVSEDSSCSMVGCGARAACAEVSTGSVEASKANLSFR
jgi:hypothetical protein